MDPSPHWQGPLSCPLPPPRPALPRHHRLYLLLQLLPLADGQRGIEQLLLGLCPQHHVGLCNSTSQGVQEDILLVPTEVGWMSGSPPPARGPWSSPGFPTPSGPRLVVLWTPRPYKVSHTARLQVPQPAGFCPQEARPGHPATLPGPRLVPYRFSVVLNSSKELTELILLGRPPSPSSASSSGSGLVFTHTGKYFSFSWQARGW